MIEFKTYAESRLEDHIQLVLEVIDDWDWKPWYPNKEELKSIYSRDGFTSDTRHYAYAGEELVGFLSSAVEEIVDGVQFGSFHIPFIKKGYEHIENELMAKTIETLKTKGVQAIRVTVMPGWGPMPQILERLGFGDQKLLAYRTVFSVNQFIEPNYTKPEHIMDIALPKDRDLLLAAMHGVSSIPKEAIERTLDYYIAHNLFIAGAVVQTDDILSYGYLFKGVRYEGDSIKRAFLPMIPIAKKGTERLILDIFKYLVQKAKDAGTDMIWHQVADLDVVEHYSELELNFEPFYQYVLRLD